VDLYPVMTKQLVWPTEDLTLKSLAKYTRFIWRDTDPSGSNSTVWYQRAIDPENENREVDQKRIIDYNADDCQATAELLAWLQRFGEVKDMKRKLSSVEDLEKRYTRPQSRQTV
jgi:predicted RecB family nuclease